MIWMRFYPYTDEGEEMFALKISYQSKRRYREDGITSISLPYSAGKNGAMEAL
jgi:hypothetical protein